MFRLVWCCIFLDKGPHIMHRKAGNTIMFSDAVKYLELEFEPGFINLLCVSKKNHITR